GCAPSSLAKGRPIVGFPANAVLDPSIVRPGETCPANPIPYSPRVVRRLVEPGVAHAAPGTRHQFERLGYFCADTDSALGKPVYNRTVTLRDTWAKIEKASRPG